MNKYYYRIDNIETENLFYTIKNNLNSTYNAVANGNDLNIKDLDIIIEGLQEIKKRATKHEIKY